MMSAQGVNIATASTAELQANESSLPVTKLEGAVTTISGFLAYGPLRIPLRDNWHKAPAKLPLKDGLVLWAKFEKPPFNAKPRLTGDATNGVDYSLFGESGKIWDDTNVMFLACEVIAKEHATVILDMSNDDNVDVYLNGKYLGITGNWVMPHGGQFHDFPVLLEKGENTLIFKQVSTQRMPRFKVNVVSGHSHDFDAAWGPREGLLTQFVYMPDNREAKPAVQWIHYWGTWP